MKLIKNCYIIRVQKCYAVGLLSYGMVWGVFFMWPHTDCAMRPVEPTLSVMISAGSHRPVSTL